MTWWIALAMQAGAAGGAQECQAALGPLYEGPEIASLTEQIDGTDIRGVPGLIQLRASRPNRLLVINGGAFAGADLRGARLSNTCFVETDFSRSDWRDVASPGIGFINANLEGARLAGARFPRILLRQANLKDVDATEVDWSGGRFDGGWNGSVENLRLDRANLRDFYFDCGITIGDGCPIDAQLRVAGVDLTGAKLSTYERVSEWIGARLDRTELSLRQLLEIDNAQLAGPLHVRGGDTIVTITPDEYRTLRPHISGANAPRPASFNCAAARTPVERAICGPESENLRTLDAEVAELFVRARARDPQVAAEQQSWLARRNRCGSEVNCIESSYQQRRDALLGRVGPPDWIRPGAVALFVEPDVHFAPGFRDHPLYRKLLPVLIDGASGRAVLRVRPDRTIQAAGDAVGANAHLCSLVAERLTFDPSNGWYSGPYEGDADTPPALRGKPLPVIRLNGDVLEVYRGGQGGWEGSEDPRPSDYASCGVRASFGDMVRVPVTPSEAEALLESYAEQQ